MTYYNYLTLAFGIQINRSLYMTELFFNPVFSYVFNKTEEHYRKLLITQQEEDGKYAGLYIDDVRLYREPKNYINLPGVKSFLFASTDDYPELENFKRFVLKLRKDIKQFQQYLAVVWFDDKLPIPYDKLPPSLTECLDHSPVKVSVPEHLMSSYKKIEHIVNYYAGLRLIL